jgi:hypothetical protein
MFKCWARHDDVQLSSACTVDWLANPSPNACRLAWFGDFTGEIYGLFLTSINYESLLRTERYPLHGDRVRVNPTTVFNVLGVEKPVDYMYTCRLG